MQMPDVDASILARKSQIVALLQGVLPRDAVIHDEAETRAYECDALTAYRCPPLAAVLPSTTAEVSAVLKICHDEGVPVVPRGAGTSLDGGALAFWQAANRSRETRRAARWSSWWWKPVTPTRTAC